VAVVVVVEQDMIQEHQILQDLLDQIFLTPIRTLLAELVVEV
tara:strand:+ start:278 stop:403 length:126 start_codon:yes stop_codon:yes gene_type:complete